MTNATQYKPYFEKLKDPRWQKRRLEIMERDGFQCQDCGDDSKTLNVHHKFYRKGADPWDYHEDDLLTLCEECHERIGASVEKLLAIVGGGFFIEHVIGYAIGIHADPSQDVQLSDHEEVQGFMDYFLVPLRDNETREAPLCHSGIVPSRVVWRLTEHRFRRPETQKTDTDTGHSDAGWWL